MYTVVLISGYKRMHSKLILKSKKKKKSVLSGHHGIDGKCIKMFIKKLIH